MIITTNATKSRPIYHVRAKRTLRASLFRPSRTAAATLSFGGAKHVRLLTSIPIF